MTCCPVWKLLLSLLPVCHRLELCRRTGEKCIVSGGGVCLFSLNTCPLCLTPSIASVSCWSSLRHKSRAISPTVVLPQLRGPLFCICYKFLLKKTLVIFRGKWICLRTSLLACTAETRNGKGKCVKWRDVAYVITFSSNTPELRWNQCLLYVKLLTQYR